MMGKNYSFKYETKTASSFVCPRSKQPIHSYNETPRVLLGNCCGFVQTIFVVRCRNKAQN